MERLIRDFLAQKKIAVAGSFRDKTKYAYKIFRMLKDKGYEVYPVHPTIREVEGQRCYAQVRDIPVSIDMVNLVTPPAVTEKILIDCREKGIRRIWLQPGAESPAAIQFCKENNMDIVYGTCLILESAQKTHGPEKI